VYEQTVVLLARATAFTVVCQACAELEASAEYTGLTAQGILRLGHDVGWTSCPRGHRIRIIRAGAAVAAEATSPLW
jgi:chromosome condensin MukBEF MukE localization factor